MYQPFESVSARSVEAQTIMERSCARALQHNIGDVTFPELCVQHTAIIRRCGPYHCECACLCRSSRRMSGVWPLACPQGSLTCRGLTGLRAKDCLSAVYRCLTHDRREQGPVRGHVHTALAVLG